MSSPVVTEALETRCLLSVGIFPYAREIGSPARSGTSTSTCGSYTITGAGSDIWNTSDQFNFDYVPLTGNGEIVARVTGVGNTNPWAKGGIMFRQSMYSNSPDAYLTMTPHDEIQFLDRATPGAAAVQSGDAVNVPFPIWEKLVRLGNTFTAYTSPDGNIWTQLGGAANVVMTSNIYVGIVACSHNTAALTSVTLDNVSVMRSPASGVYRLATRGQPTLSLDVEGVANGNQTPVSLYYARHTSNQQWLVENQGDGTFKIYAYSGQNSLQMLDYAGGSIANNTPVATYQDNGSENQRWVFKPAGSYWRIVPANGESTNQTLDIMNGNNAGVGSRTDIWSYWGGNNQLFTLSSPGTQQILQSPKKGLAGFPNEVNNIHPSWIYTWGGTEPSGLPAGVEFVPMSWGYYGNGNNGFVNWLNGVKSQPGVHELLGFNEPDSTTQSNLTVAQALDGWQYMNATGLPLIAPAAVHADDSWMQQFMAGAAQRGYRVDAVPIHWYGGDDPTGFLNYVNYIHSLYNKPIWITEFAPADWSGHFGISASQAYAFMQQVVPALNQMSFVQRYSWFSGSPGDGALGQDALYNNDGSLTPLGRLYSRM